jgi:hypothetical protein
VSAYCCIPDTGSSLEAVIYTGIVLPELSRDRRGGGGLRRTEREWRVILKRKWQDSKNYRERCTHNFTKDCIAGEFVHKRV